MPKKSKIPSTKRTKANTSSNLFTSLNLMSSDELFQIKKNVKIKHKEEKKKLLTDYRKNFEIWFYQLLSGFNLLFYGIGSKKNILEEFVLHYLFNCYDKIIVNGYIPDFKLVNLLKDIHKIISTKHSDLKINFEFKNLNTNANKIIKYLKKDNLKINTIIILINNIDGISLRSFKAQTILSNLVNTNKISMIASFDNFRTTCLWNSFTLHKFNWCFHHIPTYANYTNEIIFIDEDFSKNTKTNIEGLINVVKSFTPNQREIFSILCDATLKKNGLNLKEFKEECQNNLSINSNVQLNNYIKEMETHKVICRKIIQKRVRYHVPFSKEIICEMISIMAY